MVCGLQGGTQEPSVELEHHLLAVRGSCLIDGQSDEGQVGGLVPNCTLLGCLLGYLVRLRFPLSGGHRLVGK